MGFIFPARMRKFSERARNNNNINIFFHLARALAIAIASVVYSEIVQETRNSK